VSLRSPEGFLWWSLILTAFYFIALRFLLHMLPLPRPVVGRRDRRFYVEHSGEIKVGAVFAALRAGCLFRIVIVIVIQMHRHEQGRVPVWTSSAVSAAR